MALAESNYINETRSGEKSASFKQPHVVCSLLYQMGGTSTSPGSDSLCYDLRKLLGKDILKHFNSKFRLPSSWIISMTSHNYIVFPDGPDFLDVKLHEDFCRPDKHAECCLHGEKNLLL